MIIELLLFILGFFVLVKAANFLIDGASFVAGRFGVSSFFIGLTVVAFGTSSPELVISILAALQGSAGVALGSIIGSNISNTLLILGLCALTAPLLVKKATINKEIPFLILSVLAVALLVNDFLLEGIVPGGLSRIDGLILILFFSIFIFYTFGISRERESVFEKTIGQLRDAPKETSMTHSIVLVLVGLLGLGIGGKLIVDGAIGLAAYFGLSEAFVGLTIVAFGTSLPELAASIVAVRRGQTDIAVGNVVGSNIFNLLLILGLSSTIKSIPFTQMFNVDFVFLLLITVFLYFLIYVGKKNIIGRGEGAVLVFLYGAYLVFLLIRV